MPEVRTRNFLFAQLELAKVVEVMAESANWSTMEWST